MIPNTAQPFTYNNQQVYISGLSMTNVLLRVIGTDTFIKVGWSEGYTLLRNYPLREAISALEVVKSKVNKK